MNKLSLSILLSMAATAATAHGAMTFTTAAPVGTEVRILANVLSATQPITIDFGNGVEQKFTVDPNQPAYNRWIEGVVAGPYIIVSGQITEFELSEAQLTGAEIVDMVNLTSLELAENQIATFELKNATPLETLNLSKNCIENSPTNNPTLSLENAGSTLRFLNISHNTGLQCLDMSGLPNVEYLTLNDCPDFASIFIALPEGGHESLRSINLADCSLSNFYPISMPNLSSLDLSNNRLMTVATDEPFTLGDYPNLTSLSLSGNSQIDKIDVTKCTKLESLWVSDCRIEALDVSQCSDLRVLNISNNKMKAIDLGNNKNISSLYVRDNPIRELPIDELESLQYVDISNTYISRVNLMKAFFLKEFVASNTLLEFVDFNGQQPNRMQKIDLRNNPGFTYESMAYTVKTLPVAKKNFDNITLFLEGSNAEHADIDYATGSDLQWVCDVTGDGTAEFSPLEVTLDGATDTGENKTGVVDRLYPYMGYSMPYDLDVMETTGGKFILAQWQPEYFQTVESVQTTALKGVPMYVYAYPEEGKRFKSVTVNGTEIFSPWFIISEPSTIKVNFTSEMSAITFDVAPGQDFTFLVATAENGGSVWVDWGTGVRTEYPGQKSYTSGHTSIQGTRIDGTATSDKIAVYGDIAAIDVSGFGDVAEIFGLWDNHITGVDLTGCPDLKYFNAYWNPISSIDLSQNTALEYLNVSYTNLTSIDLSHNNNIMRLEAYSDGWGEDGIAQLESIDVSNMPYLQYIDVKNNKLKNIDLTHAPYLTWALLYGNEFANIDLTKNPALEELSAGGNQIVSIDLSKNTALTSLVLDGNLIENIDLSANTALVDLSLANNYIHSLNLNSLKRLQRIYINGNGMTAGELNDFYYTLPVRVDDGSGEELNLSYNLAVIQGDDREENDGLGADSSIAEDRGWDPSHKGTNAGCDVAYLDILTPVHGTVKVTDNEGNEYVHGSKVPKYIPLNVVCTPDEGYRFSYLTLNGEDPIVEPLFDMPGIYTRLAVTFRVADGIEDAGDDAIYIAPAAGGVNVAAPAAALSVYTTTGVTVVADCRIDGSRFVSLNPGTYVVRLKGEGFVRTRSIIVK